MTQENGHAHPAMKNMRTSRETREERIAIILATLPIASNARPDVPELERWRPAGGAAPGVVIRTVNMIFAVPTIGVPIAVTNSIRIKTRHTRSRNTMPLATPLPRWAEVASAGEHENEAERESIALQDGIARNGTHQDQTGQHPSDNPGIRDDVHQVGRKS